MPFIPSQEQIDSLYSLLKQLRSERIEIRLIRFTQWATGKENCEIEILCLENIDRYLIYYDGKIEEKYRRR